MGRGRGVMARSFSHFPVDLLLNLRCSLPVGVGRGGLSRTGRVETLFNQHNKGSKNKPHAKEHTHILQCYILQGERELEGGMNMHAW